MRARKAAAKSAPAAMVVSVTATLVGAVEISVRSKGENGWEEDQASHVLEPGASCSVGLTANQTLSVYTRPQLAVVRRN